MTARTRHTLTTVTRSPEFLGQIDEMPVAADLFCGLGGWTEGLLAEGYRVRGYDIEAHVYGEHRYPAQLVIADVMNMHGSELKDVNLIVASPPCQEYSYMAMPWSLAKAKAADIRADETGEKLRDLNALFNACFRIQREACEAAGHHIPMVVENVRGAIPWVGRSRWNFGSFHLWGDVPALMPQTIAAQKFNPDGTSHGTGSWFAIADSKDRGSKNQGGSWFNVGGPGRKVTGQNPVSGAQDGRKHHGDWFRDPTCPSRQGGQLKPPARVSVHPPVEGRKGAGAGAAWFDQNTSSLPSNSPRRKAASAMIAKIPEALSRHIARTFYPREFQDAAE